jgi:hypothetical protein
MPGLRNAEGKRGKPEKERERGNASVHTEADEGAY